MPRYKASKVHFSCNNPTAALPSALAFHDFYKRWDDGHCGAHWSCLGDKKSLKIFNRGREKLKFIFKDTKFLQWFQKQTLNLDTTLHYVE